MAIGVDDGGHVRDDGEGVLDGGHRSEVSRVRTQTGWGTLDISSAIAETHLRQGTPGQGGDEGSWTDR